jgi:hypothetical protein
MRIPEIKEYASMTQIPFENEQSDKLCEILELAGRQENGVPKGLSQCPVCGDWIGRCLWTDPLMWHLGPTRISCRCEANLCSTCGEPIYEYRLGSNVYNEAMGKIEHVPGMVGVFHRCGEPRIELPVPIQPFLDEKYSPVLAGFPVQLVYIGVRPRNDETRKPIVVKARYRFDPGSFFEDGRTKEMRYILNLPSDFYVDVAWEKKPKRWRAAKCEGSRLLSYEAGKDFETVMRKTLAVGLQPDEPAN